MISSKVMKIISAFLKVIYPVLILSFSSMLMVSGGGAINDEENSIANFAALIFLGLACILGFAAFTAYLCHCKKPHGNLRCLRYSVCLMAFVVISISLANILESVFVKASSNYYALKLILFAWGISILGYGIGLWLLKSHKTTIIAEAPEVLEKPPPRYVASNILMFPPPSYDSLPEFNVSMPEKVPLP